MKVQQLSDKLLELSHHHGLAQAEVCFVRDGQLATVREVNVLGDNLVMLSTVPPKEEAEPEGDWVVRSKEPL